MYSTRKFDPDYARMVRALGRRADVFLAAAFRNGTPARASGSATPGRTIRRWHAGAFVAQSLPA